ncbi:hypothetical protein [Chromohalobacter nigrandesensis]|uniref:hypothetical protein n=1 Tax=Chromohalobacter nigrandesensis TaxID=119863 RepID=UPI001FF309AF|nr:hypothetical protein [Chromohalobacter nigrandesensis]MCK0743586.1 hypothetical protein [Chromohalobacter nigrandesensis]
MAETENKLLTEEQEKLHEAEAQTKYHQHRLLVRLGDKISKREGYKSSELTGLVAIRYYLMQKHHWTPAQVMAMSEEHLEFAMLGESDKSTLPTKDWL